MNLRTRVMVVAIATAMTAATVFPAVVGASPVDDKRRQAAELQRQIAANDTKLVTLSEQLNGARYRMAQAEAAIAEAQQRTDAAIAQRQKIRRLLGQRAAQIYRHAGSSTPLQQMDVSSIGEMAARSKYASAAADRDDQLIARLQKAEEELAARKADLETKRSAAKAQADAADSARSKLDTTNRQSKTLLSQVNGQIADIIRRDNEAHAAALQRTAAAAAQRATNNTGSNSGHVASIPANFPNAPAPNAGAAAAVAFAKAQVGKGYRYATSGPDTFDCSGLTAAAWARGGVSLAHYSGAQYQETIRIGAGDLQPGDLVFYGPGGSQHVEIYIGGGMVVSASNPSTGVKLAGVRYGSASGYGRVRA